MILPLLDTESNVIIQSEDIVLRFLGLSIPRREQACLFPTGKVIH